MISKNPVTRRVIAYQIGTRMTKELATKVINQVLTQSTNPLFIQNDMGSQYTSKLFENPLSKFR